MSLNRYQENTCFNSKLVRLEVSRDYDRDRDEQGFNSKLVRLEVEMVKLLWMWRMFQFQTGAIRRFHHLRCILEDI